VHEGPTCVLSTLNMKDVMVLLYDTKRSVLIFSRTWRSNSRCPDEVIYMRMRHADLRSAVCGPRGISISGI
jgi:hypothetical protein